MGKILSAPALATIATPVFPEEPPPAPATAPDPAPAPSSPPGSGESAILCTTGQDNGEAEEEQEVGQVSGQGGQGCQRQGGGSHSIAVKGSRGVEAPR